MSNKLFLYSFLFMSCVGFVSQAVYAMGRGFSPKRESVRQVFSSPNTRAAVKLTQDIEQRVDAARTTMTEYLEHRDETGENFFIALDIDGVMLMSTETVELFKSASAHGIRDLALGKVNAVPAVLAFFNEAIANDVDVYIVTARPEEFFDQESQAMVNLVNRHIESLKAAGYNGIDESLFMGMSWDSYQDVVAAVNDPDRYDRLVGDYKRDVLADIMSNPKYKRYIFLDDSPWNSPTHRIPTVEQPITPERVRVVRPAAEAAAAYRFESGRYGWVKEGEPAAAAISTRNVFDELNACINRKRPASGAVEESEPAHKKPFIMGVVK